MPSKRSEPHDILSMHAILLYLFLFLSQTAAHSHPETEHEVEVQRALQAAAYHVKSCMPIIELKSECERSALVRTSYRVIYCFAEASLGTTSACRISWSSRAPTSILSRNV